MGGALEQSVQQSIRCKVFTQAKQIGGRAGRQAGGQAGRPAGREPNQGVCCHCTALTVLVLPECAVGSLCEHTRRCKVCKGLLAACNAQETGPHTHIQTAWERDAKHVAEASGLQPSNHSQKSPAFQSIRQLRRGNSTPPQHPILYGCKQRGTQHVHVQAGSPRPHL